MVNKSKVIGTSRGETPFVNYAIKNGFPYARRLSLNGNKDQGDVLLDPIAKVIVEVKAGGTAARSEPAFIAEAMRQLSEEMDNIGAAAGFLACKRAGYGDKRVGDWWAWMWASPVMREFAREKILALHPFDLALKDAVPIRMLVSDAMRLLRMDGYGTPLEES